MRKLLLAALAACAFALPAQAQDHSFPTPGNATVPGAVAMCLNSAGNAVPVSSGTCAANQQVSAATHAQCAALCSNLVVKNAAGTLFSFEVAADTTLSGAPWWLMIYDATAAPSDGAVTPAKCYAMPNGATGFTGAFATGGVAFTTGVTVAVSTTGCFTKTASTHAFIAGDFQ